MNKISPFLWFDTQAEEAAKFYTSVFKNAKITKTTYYPKSIQPETNYTPGKVMTVCFEINGQEFVALNGGPNFSFTPAISLVVYCDTQAELDQLWEKLSEGGDQSAQQCGWLKDKYGLSWQLVPSGLFELLSDPKRAERVMPEVMQMKKLDIEKLKAA
ncbi:MAG TPA: VOC family protein [Rickettsiales bacterium]|nr:VOC family protein [Rickettsiales bacterium]